MTSLTAKPFHIYDPDFLSVIGSDPTLTLLADSGTNPLFHEAVVWHPETDEVFFVQSSGSVAAGTGLNKSSIIQKISLAQLTQSNNVTTGMVTVETVDSNPQVINPNGKPGSRTRLIATGV
jgi:gluconolactonase